MIILIAAMTNERVIGKNNALLWKIPQEMKHFKETTSGHTVIMGRKTFESIGRALPNRHNIVISSTASDITGVTVCKSLGDALIEAKRFGTDIFIIGGASVYAQALPYAEKMILSIVHTLDQGDAYFPEFSEREWKLVSRQPHEQFDVCTYVRSL